MGDATMAYNNPTFSYPGNKPKLDLFTRQMVFLDKKYLVVFDRVCSLDPSYEKKWLLHTVGEPRMDGRPVSVEVPQHLETYPAGTVLIENGGGRLYCRTLFPARYLTRKVGGGATVSKVKADPRNRGRARLDGTIHGVYRRVSPSIASDNAIREDWVIEFLDRSRFRVTGSVTGEDGTGNLGNSKNSVFVSRSGRIFIPRTNWQGRPEKGDRFYFSVLSPSYRFWANGKNRAPVTRGIVKIMKEGSKVDPGNWRIEVIPLEKRKFTTFLHFLYPCDRDKSGIVPETQEMESSDGCFRGLAVADWVVLFVAEISFRGKTKYKVQGEGQRECLVLGVTPGAEYSVRADEEPPKGSGERIKASRDGTLRFRVKGPCEVEIKRVGGQFRT